MRNSPIRNNIWTKRNKGPICNNIWTQSSVITAVFVKVTFILKPLSNDKINYGQLEGKNVKSRDMQKPTPVSFNFTFIAFMSLSDWILHLVVWLKKY